MRIGEFRHGRQVAFNLFNRLRPGIAGEIVCPGQNHHRPRLEVDNVVAEANQHLRCRLAADASIDIRLAGKELARRTGPTYP